MQSHFCSLCTWFLYYIFVLNNKCVYPIQDVCQQQRRLYNWVTTDVCWQRVYLEMLFSVWVRSSLTYIITTARFCISIPNRSVSRLLLNMVRVYIYIFIKIYFFNVLFDIEYRSTIWFRCDAFFTMRWFCFLRKKKQSTPDFLYIIFGKPNCRILPTDWTSNSSMQDKAGNIISTVTNSKDYDKKWHGCSQR